jgi:deoxyribodipyrimidine photo-lyase
VTGVVWHKRDLRIRDHAPLAEACRLGEVIPLFIVEPELISAPEYDGAHHAFLMDCLAELDRAYRARGGRLTVRIGEATAVLGALHAEFRFTHLFSHEETGNGLTYARDIRVARWARSHGVAWTEIPQTGVVRRLRSRDGWSRTWQARMGAPLVPAPAVVRVPEAVASQGIPGHAAAGVAPNTKGIPRGGESHAHATLAAFLEERGQHYFRELSSPLTGAAGCSRISEHLAYGTISMRQVWHATQARRAGVRGLDPAARTPWLKSLRAFEARLHWHCHFMQKLEDEPRIEFENISRAHDGLREDEFDEARFAAWREGRTGYPMVDACMRMLLATGWVNFRMRAMLVSFAAYDLWLHWRRPAVFLARHFLDFEPGIHFAQFQMQSGTTGINTLRMYNPTKQAQDHDPTGAFIRAWVPELAALPVPLVHEPWKLRAEDQARFGVRLGTDYPRPVVDHAVAVAKARARFAELRRRPEFRDAARAVMERHGSRKRPASRRSARAAAPSAPDLFDSHAEDAS